MPELTTAERSAILKEKVDGVAARYRQDLEQYDVERYIGCTVELTPPPGTVEPLKFFCVGVTHTRLGLDDSFADQWYLLGDDGRSYGLTQEWDISVID
jgi:hypothetical protein